MFNLLTRYCGYPNLSIQLITSMFVHLITSGKEVVLFTNDSSKKTSEDGVTQCECGLKINIDFDTI